MPYKDEQPTSDATHYMHQSRQRHPCSMMRKKMLHLSALGYSIQMFDVNINKEVASMLDCYVPEFKFTTAKPFVRAEMEGARIAN